MKTPRLSIIIMLFTLSGPLFVGCSNSAPQPSDQNQTTHTPDGIEPPEKLQTTTIGDTPNLHQFQGFYLAGQPSEEDLQTAKQIGIQTVINLRMSEEVSFDEQQAVTDLGMSYHNPGIGSPDMMTDELFGEIRGILNDETNHPILLHCGSANRVGAIWLAYRALDGGLSYEAALTEAKTVGLRNPLMEEKAKDYIERHKK